MAVLIHPCQAARLAASWCLRCICVAVPSQITPLIDRCVDGIENMRSSPEAIAGYSSALAAVLGSVRLSPLGVPHTKGKVITFHFTFILFNGFAPGLKVRFFRQRILTHTYASPDARDRVSMSHTSASLGANVLIIVSYQTRIIHFSF